MLQRFQNFSVLCAIVLAAVCIVLLLSSLIESGEGQYPTWKKACFELPILLYVIVLVGFLMPTKLPKLQVFVVACCGPAALAYISRISKYSDRRVARHHAEFIASQQELTQQIEETKVRIMSLAEKMELEKINQSKRVSRYERPPVI